MRALFIHQNFPGQYRYLAPHLASLPGAEVVALGEKTQLLSGSKVHPAGIRIFGYDAPPIEPGNLTLDEQSLIKAIRRGATVAGQAGALKRQGFVPDVVFAHIAWGEALFIKDIFPDARLLLYCELFTQPRGADIGFDPEFPKISSEDLWIRVMNAHPLMALNASDWGIAPTAWQKGQFPQDYRDRISVIHDGVDTDLFAPRADAVFRVPGTGLALTRDSQVVTYVARSLVPHRGFHSFMRAIPEIQRRRPQAQIVIAGSDEVSYSRRLPPGDSYRKRLLKELDGRIDLARVHFTGAISQADYLALLQVSSAHVYLTYPFVLSWSFIEALAAGCLMIGSRTAPVEEVIVDGENGLLADFFSPQEIAERVDQALDGSGALQVLRAAARRTAVARYDFRRVCLPRHLELVENLISRAPQAPNENPAKSRSESRASGNSREAAAQSNGRRGRRARPRPRRS